MKFSTGINLFIALIVSLSAHCQTQTTIKETITKDGQPQLLGGPVYQLYDKNGSALNLSSDAGGNLNVNVMAGGGTVAGTVSIDQSAMGTSNGVVLRDHAGSFGGLYEGTDVDSDIVHSAPYTLPVESYLKMFNGTTWDRVRGTTTGGLTVTPQATESFLGKVGYIVYATSATITRPSGTPTYAINSVISNSASAPVVMTFAGVGRIAQGSVSLTKARFTTDQSANTTQFRLWLFNAAPTAINDTSPFTVLYADADKRIGYIDFPACATEGSGSDCAYAMWKDIPIDFRCASASTTIYGILETKTAFTAAAGQNFHIALVFRQQ